MDTLRTVIGNSSDSSSLIDFSGLTSMLMPFVILISIVSLAIGALYIFNAILTYRSHKAMIETRNILREMNERDKARSTLQTPPQEL